MVGDNKTGDEDDHIIGLSDRKLAIIRSALDRELSCSDVDRQDRAIEVLDDLPETEERHHV